MIRFLSLVLIFGGMVRAETDCPTTKDIAFLRTLYQEQKFALIAFQGEVYRNNNACKGVPEIDLEMGKALYQLGAFSRARLLLKPHLAMAEPSYRRYWAESHLLDMDSPNMLDSLRNYLEANHNLKDWGDGEKPALLAAILFLKGEAKAAKKSWPEVVEGGNSASPCQDPMEPRCYLEIGLQKPALAASLSLFPGLGYAYAGRVGDGFFAFTLVSLFYGVAAYYGQYGSPARAWTFASFGSVFYLSNIYGAYQTVKRTNKVRQSRFLMAFHRRLFQ